MVLIYYGSPAGINPSPQRIKGNSNDTYDFFGWSVAAAGDVNADGFNDMITGSPNFSSGQADADAAFIYFGNNGRGLRNAIRLYNSDLVTLFNYQQQTKSNFGIGLSTHSFLGANSGKLVWEAIANGNSFPTGTNGLLANSTSYTGFQKGYHNLTGAELKTTIGKQGSRTNLRVRIRYNPTLALTGQIYGPWRYLTGPSTGSTSAPVPPTSRNISEENQVIKTYVYPNPAASELHVSTEKDLFIAESALLTTDGSVVKRWKGGSEKLRFRGMRPGRYILRVRYTNATESSHPVVVQ